jgi:hypothetical protein
MKMADPAWSATGPENTRIRVTSLKPDLWLFIFSEIITLCPVLKSFARVRSPILERQAAEPPASGVLLAAHVRGSLSHFFKLLDVLI